MRKGKNSNSTSIDIRKINHDLQHILLFCDYFVSPEVVMCHSPCVWVEM